MPRPLMLLVLACLLATGCGKSTPGFYGQGDVVASARTVGGVGDTVVADEPFVIRFEIRAESGSSQPRNYGLEVRRNDLDWLPVYRSDFPYPELRTTRVGITGVDSIQSFAAVPAEVDWPIVIRRWADGGITNENGDRFAFRLVHAAGQPVKGEDPIEVHLEIPEGHLGGTFVETPGRIGPWQSDDEGLYFIMEPTETDNLLMMVHSEDGGGTWRELDGRNRPVADDLEGLASAVHDGIIHILHQQSEHVWYHAFSMTTDTWIVRDELVSEPGEPPVQVASLEAKPDGSLVAFYGGPRNVIIRMRSPEGEWSGEITVDGERAYHFSGPVSALLPNGSVQLAYTSRDGSLWTRRVNHNGELGQRVLLSSRIDTTEEGVGSVLPLNFDPVHRETVVVYREGDGLLFERRLRQDGTLSMPRKVSDMPVVQNAVDSDQTGADMIVNEGRVHVLFIEEKTGALYHTSSARTGIFSPPEAVGIGMNAQWIRGQVITREGQIVYGYVVDTGSDGGSGRNRFGSVTLR